jgi:hypothetical protein
MNEIECCVETGAGWHALIEEMNKEMRAIGVDFRFAQIKEKFGALRVYIAPECEDATFRTNDERVESLYEIIKKYEEMSKHVCEKCGLDNANQVVIDGWAQTLCQKCEKIKIEKK